MKMEVGMGIAVEIEMKAEMEDFILSLKMMMLILG